MNQLRLSKTAAALLLALPPLCLADTASAPATSPTPAPKAEDAAQVSGFNAAHLKALGIDPSVAAYFSQGPRFQPGVTDAEVSVNGVGQGSVKAQFSNAGKLCADGAFMSSAGIRQPASVLSGSRDTDCDALKKAWPAASVDLMPGTQRIGIVVPPEAVMDEHDPSRYEQGGIGSLLNYSGYDSHFSSPSGKSEYRSLMLDGGFNAAGWMVRTAHNFSQSSDGTRTSQSAYLYAQRALTSLRKLLQVGQVSYSGYTLSGAPINGVRLSPESGLTGDNSGVSVSGIAPAAQSRVEVKQNGIVILSTLVPVGPFTLNNLPVLNTSSDLTLTVTEPGGRQSSRIINAADFRQRVSQAPAGFSLAAGEVRSTGSGSHAPRPRVVSFSDGWNFSRDVMGTADVTWASTWNAAGTHLAYSPVENILLGTDLAVSRDTRHDVQGIKTGVDATWLAPGGLSFSGNIAKYTSGYRELTDTLYEGNVYSDYSAGVSASWSHEVAGSFGVSAGQSRTGDKSSQSRYYMLSWSHQLPRGTVSVNWQHQDSRTLVCDDGRPCEKSDRNSLFVNLSFPLGNITTGAYYRNSDDRQVAGARASGSLTENSDWSLSAERVMGDEPYNNVSGGLNSNLHYTTLDLYGSADSENSRSYSTSLSGGVVASREGVAFSPERVSDTFGIVSVSPAAGGVEFDSPGGRTWTDWWGHAAVPSLNAWHTSQVEMNTEHLPAHMDVTNGYRKIAAGHGAVTATHFALQKTRNGLLTVHLADGTLLPKGSALTDDAGNYVTTAVDEGMVFISNLDEVKALKAEWSAGSCRLSFSVPEQAPDDVGYEQINATCR